MAQDIWAVLDRLRQRLANGTLSRTPPEPRLQSSSAIDPPSFPAPWDPARVAICGFLRAQFARRDVMAADITLPDQAEIDKGATVPWADGVLDGVLSHHVSEKDEAGAQRLFAAIEAAVARPTPESIRNLCESARSDLSTSSADQIVEMVRRSALHAARLQQLALWLATNAPDRAPVKLGIILLGIVPVPESTELLKTFARHDEFTIYALVALLNATPRAEHDRLLWELARQVDGWGRVHVVERMAGTTDPEVKHWLLREGYKNSIMYEYLAWTCATAGELKQALQAPEPDDALLTGAGEILSALIGGPARGMKDYQDGGAAALLYVDHMLRRPPSDLGHFTAVYAIRTYAETSDWSEALRTDVIEKADRILLQPKWRQLALDRLRSGNAAQFWQACEVGDKIGIDVWVYRFERQQTGQSDEWFHLMRTNDSARIDQVLDLARQQIDLRAIARGPAEEMGLGPGFSQHGHLDFILGALGRFPGKGWDVLAAGLQSPVIRNRNLALRVLSEWRAEHWPDQARSLLTSALAREPAEDVRKRIQAVLDGRPLE